MKRVITIVGTSLLTNYLKKRNTIETDCKSIENKPCINYDEEIERVKKIKKALLPFARNGNDSCAELTTILKLQSIYEDIEIFLIATDTIESVLICEVLQEVLEEKNININFDFTTSTINDLRVHRLDYFNKGIHNLIDNIFSIITNDKGHVFKSNEVIFNITGGYKAIIPYFSTIAQVFNYEIVYTFEDKNYSSDLLEIKPLPIEIDRGLLELYYPYLDNVSLIKDDIEKRLTDLGLYDNGLTPLGKIALLTIKNTPLSKDVFGHFIEYKLYEYCVKNFFDKSFKESCLDFEYSNIGHGVALGKGLTDIDIMLEKGNEVVWIEVKPISYLIDESNKNKLIEQIRDKQLAKWEESNFKNKILKKYILVVYLYQENIINTIKKEVIEEFNKLFSSMIDFSICYFTIGLSKSDNKINTITSATYQTVMKDFQIKQLKRIDNV